MHTRVRKGISAEITSFWKKRSALLLIVFCVGTRFPALFFCNFSASLALFTHSSSPLASRSSAAADCCSATNRRRWVNWQFTVPVRKILHVVSDCCSLSLDDPSSRVVGCAIKSLLLLLRHCQLLRLSL